MTKKGSFLLALAALLFVGMKGYTKNRSNPGADAVFIVQHTDSLTADSLYRQALVSIEQQDLQSAYRLVNAAIEAHGEMPDYWKLLLQIQNHGGDPEGSVRTLARLIELEPTERQYYLDRGFVLAYMGNFDESLQQYEQLTQKLGKDDQVFTAIATVYRMMDDQPAAIAELESLLQQGTDKSIAYVMLGELYLEEDNVSRAADVLGRGLNKFPQDPLLQIGMADALIEQGKVAEAFAYLSKGFNSELLELDYKSGLLYRSLQAGVYDSKDIQALADTLVDDYPADPRSHAVRGDINNQMGDLVEARISYLKALEINRYIPSIWQQLIFLSFMDEDWKEAQQTGRRAVELFPNDPDLLFYTGNAYMMENRNEEARPFLEAALNNAPSENEGFLSMVYGGLGGIYHALGMYAESDVAFKESLAIDSLDTFSLNNYAYYLAERNENLEEAKRMSALTLELRPNNASSEDTYAWILYKMGEYKEALNWIKRAIKNDLDGPSAVLLEHYGDILYRNGKTRDAVSQWKNALKVVDVKDESFDRLNRKVQERRIVE